MELQSELYHYAKRFLNIDRENVDISECVPCSFYDENKPFETILSIFLLTFWSHRV